MRQYPRGVVLVTGPPDRQVHHARAMVNDINENEFGHILTVEDPIEFVHESKIMPYQPAAKSGPTRCRSQCTSKRAARGSGHHPGRRMRDLETIRLALTRPKPATWCSARCIPARRQRP